MRALVLRMMFASLVLCSVVFVSWGLDMESEIQIGDGGSARAYSLTTGYVCTCLVIVWAWCVWFVL